MPIATALQLYIPDISQSWQVSGVHDAEGSTCLYRCNLRSEARKGFPRQSEVGWRYSHETIGEALVPKKNGLKYVQ